MIPNSISNQYFSTPCLRSKGARPGWRHFSSRRQRSRRPICPIIQRLPPPPLLPLSLLLLLIPLLPKLKSPPQTQPHPRLRSPRVRRPKRRRINSRARSVRRGNWNSSGRPGGSSSTSPPTRRTTTAPSGQTWATSPGATGHPSRPHRVVLRAAASLRPTRGRRPSRGWRGWRGPWRTSGSRPSPSNSRSDDPFFRPMVVRTCVALCTLVLRLSE